MVGKIKAQTALKDPVTDLLVGIETIGGKNRLLTDTNISSVNIPQGQDPVPDTFFTVLTAGAVSDTVRVQIAATVNDSTSPDSDLPAVDVTYVLVAEDVGDEHKLAENIVEALEADGNFQTAFLEADVIEGGQRPIIHLSSSEFSLTGEFHERPNFGDVAVTVTGSTTINIDSDNQKLVSRAKPTSLARDPDNPHRLGIIGISGTVKSIADEVDELIELFAEDGGGSNDLTINGSGTPVEFTIDAEAAGGRVRVIEAIKVYGSDGNIKVGNSNFLGLNSPISNGLEIQVTKDSTTTVFRNVKTTSDFLARLSSSPSNSLIIPSSGVDYINCTFDLVSRNIQLKLEPGTTDQIKIIVQDNLSSVNELFLVAEGFLEED